MTAQLCDIIVFAGACLSSSTATLVFAYDVAAIAQAILIPPPSEDTDAAW